MNTPFASSTAIIFCFLSSFFFTFSSARVPFQLHFHRTTSNSLPNNPRSHPHSNPEPQTLPSTTHPNPIQPSHPLPFTVFTLDPPLPRHPLPLSSRLDSWKPRPRPHNSHPLPRGGVRHVARGWTRFGVVEPTLFRQRHMSMERRRVSEPQHHHIKHPHTGFVKRIRKFLNPF